MDQLTRDLRAGLIAQSTSAQAGMILAALGLVQRHLLEFPLLDHFAAFLETYAPPLQRCGASVSLVADQVCVQWPFWGSATVNPQNRHILFTPLKHAPQSISWILPSPHSFVESLPLAHTSEELDRLSAKAVAEGKAAAVSRMKRRDSLVESAPTLVSLVVSERDPIALELLTKLAFPCLHHLTLCSTEATSAWLTTLANKPFWRQLRTVKASFFRIESAVDWAKLWAPADLQFEEIRLNCTETEPAMALVRSPLPRLRTLALSGVVRDPILLALASASLPALRDLDLRRTSITPGALKAFVATPKPGLPRLERLGFDFASDRREDYRDWNGAVVDWGYERMTAQELNDFFLANSSLQLLPE